MAERRNRKHSKIDALPPDIKAAVEQMMLGADIYDDIVAYLREQGYSISKSSVSRYARAYLAEREALIVANTNMRNLLEEINRYPDLDTTEAIVRVVSHNVLSTLSAKSDDEWQEVDLSKLLKEANALVRASAYKKADRPAKSGRARYRAGRGQGAGICGARQGAARPVPATGRVRGRGKKATGDYRGG